MQAVQQSEKKCSGCLKTLAIDKFKYMVNSDRITSRCIACLERKKARHIPSTNILWIKYPELKNVTDWETYPKSTIISKTKMIFTCQKCTHITEISPVELLQLPYCVSCGLCFLQRKSSKNNIVEQTEKIILNSPDYLTFNDQVKNLQIVDRGDVQEILAKYYFESHKKHYSLKKYYCRLLGDEIPGYIRLGNKDIGTDGVILHENGKISLVQVKFRSDEGKYLQRECLSNMSLEALGLEDKFEVLYLFSNTLFTPKLISEYEQRKVKYVMFDELQSCDWALIQEWVKSDRQEYPSSFYRIKKLRDWQKEAKRFVFSADQGYTCMFGRKNIIAPTGSGKTVLGNTVLNIRRKSSEENPVYFYQKCLVIVPNLHLLGQWFERLASWNPDRNFLVIGSDLDEEDETNVPYILTTDKDEIDIFLEEQENYIVICTYQSLDKLLCVSPRFDITLADEAHLTCGTTNSNFTLVAKEDFPCRNILYLTATPKVYRGLKEDSYVSMDDEKIYGTRHTYSFKRAIEEKIISDYKIIIGTGRKTTQKRDNVEFNARFLCEAIRKYNLNSILVCSTSHERSKTLYSRVKSIIEEFNLSHDLILMKKNATSTDKNVVINKVSKGTPSVIFNVRVFSLGSDIPSLHGVFLSGDKKSVIDIVQTIGRALRIHPNKSFGHILLPCLIEDSFDEEGEYQNVRKVIQSLGTVDDCLIETVVARKRGKQGIRHIVWDNVETWVETCEDNEEVEINYELEMLDRFCSSKNISPYYKLDLLVDYCMEERDIPVQSLVIDDVNIGTFFFKMFAGYRNKNIWEIFLERVKNIPEIIEKITQRSENKEKTKHSRNIPIEERVMYIENFWQENRKFPGKGDTYNGVKLIGTFENIVHGKIDKEKIDNLLENTSEEFRLTIHERMQNKRKISKVRGEERLDILWDFLEKYRKFPCRKEVYMNIDIGRSCIGILAETTYKSHRENFLNRIREEIPELVPELEKRLEKLNNQERKDNLKIKPEERFQLLVSYCEEKDDYPVKQEPVIGNFSQHLLHDPKKYKKYRTEWLEILRNISPKMANIINTRAKY